MKATHSKHQWDDPRTKATKTIRTRLDRAPAERQLVRVLGAICKSAKEYLDQSGRWESGIHMGIANGSLYLKEGGDLWEPLVVLTDRRADSLTIAGIETNEDDAKHW